MAKKKIEDAPGLDLTPIMNMVLVLIPLMLLNVVFMEITIIDVTMPQRSAGAAMNNGEPPKSLQLFVSKQGFTIVENGVPMPAIENCAADGPTICLNDKDDELDVANYRWLALYNTLFDIKSKADWTDHETITIVADSAVNFGVLVKAMDVSRYQLVPKSEWGSATKGKRFENEAAFNDSTTVFLTKDGVKTPLSLFPLVVLGMPTVSQ